MDKVKEIEASFNHGLSLAERKNVVVTGVKKIESFDSNEFMIDTTLGFLNIKGDELEIIKLDTYQGNVSIKGKVNSFSYKETINKISGYFVIYPIIVESDILGLLIFAKETVFTNEEKILTNIILKLIENR